MWRSIWTGQEYVNVILAYHFWTTCLMWEQAHSPAFLTAGLSWRIWKRLCIIMKWRITWWVNKSHFLITKTAYFLLRCLWKPFLHATFGMNAYSWRNVCLWCLHDLQVRVCVESLSTHSSLQNYAWCLVLHSSSFYTFYNRTNLL